MTVVVGVLNKKGVAIAADSATTNDMMNNATGEREKKVVNSGNKMLRLSDKMPIGVMIVGSAQLSGIPWDVLIRWYRKQLGDKTFSSVEEGAHDLLETITKQDFFQQSCMQKRPNYLTQLIFAGYGALEYPQLVHVDIKGVTLEEVTNPEEYESPMRAVIHSTFHTPYQISDEHPSEIRYFGQASIAAALTDNVRENEDVHMFCSEVRNIFSDIIDEAVKEGALKLNSKFDTFCFYKEMLSVFKKEHEDANQLWLDGLEHYTLQEMAALANNLINFTELYHKLMCLDESVGGLIDLAVITREDGFQWLNRKSWYEPSKGGQYGKFGI